MRTSKRKQKTRLADDQHAHPDVIHTTRKRQSIFTKLKSAKGMSIYKRGLLWYAHHDNESHYTEGTIFSHRL
jgi:hypothetical protein